MTEKMPVYKLPRIRKHLRKKLHLSDDGLTSYLIMKYNLDHNPTRSEIVTLTAFDNFNK